MKEKCEYGLSCPIKPLIEAQVGLEDELDLVERLTNPESKREEEDKAIRVRTLRGKIQQINSRLTDYPPCQYCFYQ